MGPTDEVENNSIQRNRTISSVTEGKEGRMVVDAGKFRGRIARGFELVN